MLALELKDNEIIRIGRDIILTLASEKNTVAIHAPVLMKIRRHPKVECYKCKSLNVMQNKHNVMVYECVDCGAIWE